MSDDDWSHLPDLLARPLDDLLAIIFDDMRGESLRQLITLEWHGRRRVRVLRAALVKLNMVPWPEVGPDSKAVRQAAWPF